MAAYSIEVLENMVLRHVADTKNYLPENLSALDEKKQHELRLLAYLNHVKLASDDMLLRYEQLLTEATPRPAVLQPRQPSGPSTPPPPTVMPTPTVPTHHASGPSNPQSYPEPSAPPYHAFPTYTHQLSEPSNRRAENLYSQQTGLIADFALFLNTAFNPNPSHPTLRSRGIGMDRISIQILKNNLFTKKLMGLIDYLKSKELLTYEADKSGHVNIQTRSMHELIPILNNLKSVRNNDPKWQDILILLQYRHGRDSNKNEGTFAGFGVSRTDKLAAVDKVLQFLIDSTPLSLEPRDIKALKNSALGNIIKDLQKRYPDLAKELNKPLSESSSSLSFLPNHGNKQNPPSSAPPAWIRAVIFGDNTQGKQELIDDIGFDARGIINIDDNTKLRVLTHNPGAPMHAHRGMDMDAIIACFDVTNKKSFQNVARWLGEADRCHSKLDPNKIFIVATNSKSPNPAFHLSEARDYAYTLGFTYIETSSQNCQKLLGALASVKPATNAPAKRR